MSTITTVMYSGYGQPCLRRKHSVQLCMQFSGLGDTAFLACLLARFQYSCFTDITAITLS
jgi:hypothetical protein